jgi:hypothetical protein
MIVIHFHSMCRSFQYMSIRFVGCSNTGVRVFYVPPIGGTEMDILCDIVALVNFPSLRIFKDYHVFRMRASRCSCLTPLVQFFPYTSVYLVAAGEGLEAVLGKYSISSWFFLAPLDGNVEVKLNSHAGTKDEKRVTVEIGQFLVADPHEAVIDLPKSSSRLLLAFHIPQVARLIRKNVEKRKFEKWKKRHGERASLVRDGRGDEDYIYIYIYIYICRIYSV